MVKGKPVVAVWSYPRPPRVERVADRLSVIYENTTIVDTLRGLRVPKQGILPHTIFVRGIF